MFALLGLLAVAGGLTLSSVLLARRVGPEFGLLETLYSTTDFQGPPLLRRQDSSFDLSFPGAAIVVPKKFFSVRWEGFWDVGGNEAVDIYASGDDHVAILVDDALVVERSTGMGGRSGRSSLSEGVHRLKVEYVQYEGGSQLKVLWAPAGRSARSFRGRRACSSGAPNRETWSWPGVLTCCGAARPSCGLPPGPPSRPSRCVLIRRWRRLGVNAAWAGWCGTCTSVTVHGRSSIPRRADSCSLSSSPG